jgi:uncharacterized membrane protein
MNRSIKYLGLVLVMLLGLYPIVELTRVIVVSGVYYFPEMKGQFAAEISIMWILYIMIVPVFLLLNQHRIRNYNKLKTKLLKRKQAGEINVLLPESNSFIKVNLLD